MPPFAVKFRRYPHVPAGVARLTGLVWKVTIVPVILRTADVNGATIRVGGIATTRLGLLFVLIAISGLPVTSQTPMRFEVASIRPNANRAPEADVVFLPGGQFRAANATAHDLILAAYDAASFRVAGGPDWIRSEQYDVQTRASADATTQETRAMLRKLT